MEKIKELRMTLIIILVGVFFISGCFFNDKHTITFKTNGGSEVKNMSVKSGSKIENVETPKKDGYIFDGWYLDGEEFNFDTKVDEDMTLVAKWIKESFDENNTGEEIDSSTTTTTTAPTTTVSSTTTKDSSATTSKKTTKKTTTKAKTTTTSKKTTTTTTTTAAVEVNKPLEPGVSDVPSIEPLPVVPTTKQIDIKIELLKEEVTTSEEEVEEKNKELEMVEYLKITRTLEDVNVLSNISDEDLEKLLKSDMNTWQIISNHAYFYEYVVDDSVVLLKGDKDVTSFTVVYDGSSFIFEYDSETSSWFIKYPTVSVGTGLNVVYYNNIETAIKVATEGDTVKLLANQVVSENLKLTNTIELDGSNYTITNNEGYLIDIENIVYDDSSELNIHDLVLDVDSFIYVGKSKFTNIKLDNVTGNIKNHKMDNEVIGLFENTSLLQQLQTN